MRDYILDIDHFVGLMAGNEHLLKRIREVKNDQARFGTTVTVLSDLYLFIRSSAQMESNTASLTELLNDIYIWGFDRGAAEIAGEILTQQRELTRPISRVEAEIAAVVRQRQAVLLSGSEHFGEVRDVSRENWLVPGR